MSDGVRAGGQVSGPNEVLKPPPKYDGRLRTISGRPIGGVLPYWLHEVTERVWFLWHTGFIIAAELPPYYILGASQVDWMKNRASQWVYHINNNTGLKPKPLPIVVRLACEMVASM